MTSSINYHKEFNSLFDSLRETSIFKRMEKTVEGSPWHREANVLVHTEMVINEYIRLVTEADPGYVWTRDDFLGAVSCLFHDTGKPLAEVAKYSEARGNYRSYGGHELISAHLWQDYASSRGKQFTAAEIFRIMWMIEHHMPWNVENVKKVEQLVATAGYLGMDVYINALLADQYGRISDDAAIHRARSYKWTRDFINQASEVPVTIVDHSQPFAIMPIAPSGAGKSTYLKKLRDEGRKVEVFSLDLLRHEFYHQTDYEKAYEGSVKDKSFESRANARFHRVAKEAAESGHDLYIDNTNLSAKRRKWYLDIVRKHGFQTRAVLMPASLNVLLERQKTRGDKTVPDNAVKMQYKSLQTPMMGEFDEIVVSDHNIRQHP